MDTALELRIKRDKGETISPSEIDRLLARSRLVRRLIAVEPDRGLPLVWRLLALSQIPFAERLIYTQTLADRALRELGTPSGFTLSGSATDLLVCYNAMLATALIRLGQHRAPAVSAAIGWILKHQSFARGRKTAWDGVGIQKYGGCLKATPCYIGVVKSLRALLEYRRKQRDPHLDLRIDEGIEYVLGHHLFKRRHDGAPIVPHILEVSFPESYNLSLVELLELADQAEALGDERVRPALAHAQSLRCPDGTWKATYAYSAKGFVPFDRPGNSALWAGSILKRICAKAQ